MKTTKNIIIIDLEATCWNGPVPQGQLNEIIEIGICTLNTETSEISKNKGILIKPERSKVSPFCTELTTITQELLDAEGVTFSEACKMLRTELSQNHMNVKQLFFETKGLQKKVGMKGALDILNTPLEGTHHRGIDDAKNIAKILDWCNLQKGV